MTGLSYDALRVRQMLTNAQKPEPKRHVANISAALKEGNTVIDYIAGRIEFEDSPLSHDEMLISIMNEDGTRNIKSVKKHPYIRIVCNNGVCGKAQINGDVTILGNVKKLSVKHIAYVDGMVHTCCCVVNNNIVTTDRNIKIIYGPELRRKLNKDTSVRAKVYNIDGSLPMLKVNVTGVDVEVILCGDSREILAFRDAQVKGNVESCGALVDVRVTNPKQWRMRMDEMTLKEYKPMPMIGSRY